MKQPTLAQRARLRSLLPNNYPRYVRVYDNGGKTADRYTVVFTGRYNNIGRRRGEGRRFEYWHVGMSEHPFHPQGVCISDSSDKLIDVDTEFNRWPVQIGESGHLGKRIHWHELPEDCQKAALHFYKELWNLYPAEAQDGKLQLPRLGSG